MKRLLFVLTSVVFLSGCHKHKDESVSGGGKTLSMAIDSIFENGGFAGIDSSSYGYDGDGHLMSMHSVYDSGNVSVRVGTTYTRDGKGRTTGISQTFEYLENGVNQFPGEDEVGITEVAYTAGTDQIHHIVVYGTLEGRQDGDSAAYDYTAGKLTATRVFHLNGSGSASMTAGNTWNFNDAGELSACSIYSEELQQQVDYVFTLDGKTNPLKLGLEQVHTTYGSVSPDNVVRQVAHMKDDGTTVTDTENFTYNGDGKPETAISASDASSLVRHTHYFYQ